MAVILDHVDVFLKKFVAFPSAQARHAVVLWVAHAHLVSCFDSTPRLILSSAEKQSGKSRTLELLELLTPNSLRTASASTAALYRMIAAANREEAPNGLPTLLIDEYDTIYNSRPAEGAEELRSLINCGHRRGAVVLRCEGNNHEPRKYETFAAVALAGIGNLPDTITDRAVLIQMRRRKPEEKVEPFRYRDHEMEGLEIGDSLAVWAEDMAEMAAEHRPETDLVDRPADVWEPLLTVAEIAEGLWPQRARFASVAFTKSEITVQSIGVELLGDIRTVWPLGSSAVASQSLVNILCGDPEMRWGELNGKGLSARGLAMLLKPFSVLSQRTDKARIYSLNDFADPWTRYLPPPVA